MACENSLRHPKRRKDKQRIAAETTDNASSSEKSTGKETRAVTQKGRFSSPMFIRTFLYCFGVKK
jgi:hypothetical protein